MAEEGSREEKNMSKENVSLQKLMYMIGYDTLMEIFEISLERKGIGIICVLERVGRVCVYDTSKI